MRVSLTRHGERTLIRAQDGRIIGKVEPLRYSCNRWYGTYCWEAYPDGADEARVLGGYCIPGALFSKRSHPNIREAARQAVLALNKARAMEAK